MHLHIGAGIKLAGAGMLGTAFGAVLSQAVPHAASQITGELTMDLKTICAVGGVVLMGSWHASQWMQKVSDRLSDVEDVIKKLPCQQPGALHCAAREPSRKPL